MHCLKKRASKPSSGDALIISLGQVRLSTKEFKYLEFADQVVYFNRNGIASTSYLRVSVNGSDRNLELAQINSYDDAVEPSEGMFGER